MCNPMFVTHAQTDYGVLLRAFHFMSACLAGRDFLNQEPESAEHIAVKLKQINSRIADPRAAFIERTRVSQDHRSIHHRDGDSLQVKDFILRLGLRLTFMCTAKGPNDMSNMKQKKISFAAPSFN